MFRSHKSKNKVSELLRPHFAPLKLEQMITAGRTFPVTARVDLQRALEKLFADRYPARLVGIHTEFGHETIHEKEDKEASRKGFCRQCRTGTQACCESRPQNSQDVRHKTLFLERW